MIRRSLAAIAIASTMAVPSLALADDGGTGNGGSSGAGGSTGAGTGTSTIDESCTVAVQTIEGTTCMSCMGPCTNAGSGYMFVCNYDANTEVWCNGPPRDASPGQGCSLGREPAAAAPWALGALAALAAMAVRRRRS